MGKGGCSLRPDPWEGFMNLVAALFVVGLNTQKFPLDVFGSRGRRRLKWRLEGASWSWNRLSEVAVVMGIAPNVGATKIKTKKP